MARKHRLHTSIKLTVAAALLLAVSACGKGGAGGGSGGLKDAPKEVAAVYQSARCISCHGTDLQGRVGPGTNLQKVGARMSIEEIIKQIEEGEGTMPAYKDQLTAEEITGLANWLANKK